MAEFPEIDELVTAVVKKILPYGAFCYLPEYNIEAFMHVSQVSSGWVKNIHEFISEGQRLTVKVHHLDKEKNQVDISLKRVTEDEKRKKQEQIRRETRGAKLLEFAIKNSGSKDSFEEVKTEIIESYDDIFALFEDVHENGKKILDDFKFSKKLKDEIDTIASTSIKKPEVVLEGEVTLSCPESSGVEKIKDVLIIDDKDISIHYLGAPRYKITLKAPDYKSGEKKLSSLILQLEKKSKKSGCIFKFERASS
ncbi:S1 RNA-binding domain-containing protein [Candidatus Micrarchaeota archaeon]|nr:S1 RNA-binding domain-containing protein [Candidatus Micrarchaeota archaeon]